MFWKRKSKYKIGTPFDENIDIDILGKMETGKCCRNVLLAYILKGIPEGGTISIVDMTHSEPKSLCSNAKGYKPKKNYEVISMDKFDIKDQINYFIRVIEII